MSVTLALTITQTYPLCSDSTEPHEWPSQRLPRDPSAASIANSRERACSRECRESCVPAMSHPNLQHAHGLPRPTFSSQSERRERDRPWKRWIIETMGCVPSRKLAEQTVLLLLLNLLNTHNTPSIRTFSRSSSFFCSRSSANLLSSTRSRLALLPG